MADRFIAKPVMYDEAHALRWQDADAARSYRNRPPYAPEMFDVLSGLIVDAPRAVLDVGCGTGRVARELAPSVARIDAVDIAAEMIAEGRRLPGGDAGNIRWMIGRGEDAPLDPPYALIVGGESLHWMDWPIILPRFAQALTPNGVLAIVRVEDTAPAPWRTGLLEIIKRYSTHKAWPSFDMLSAWEKAGLYRPLGSRVTQPIDFVQSVEDFIDAHHAMSSLTRSHIDADAFDAEMRTLLAPHCPGGILRRSIAAMIEWGTPLDRGG
jgi:SAM-dependent methyltransferase